MIAYLLITAFVACAAFPLLRWHTARKRIDLSNLLDYHARISTLVSELLAQANDLDQHLAYMPENIRAQNRQEISRICRELVIISESLPMITNQLTAGELKHSRRSLLASLHTADAVKTRLSKIRLNLEDVD